MTVLVKQQIFAAEELSKNVKTRNKKPQKNNKQKNQRNATEQKYICKECKEFFIENCDCITEGRF